MSKLCLGSVFVLVFIVILIAIRTEMKIRNENKIPFKEEV